MDKVASDNPRASWAGNAATSSSADCSAQSEFAKALGQEAQSSSSAGQPMCTNLTAPTPREQAAQQSLPSAHQKPTSAGVSSGTSASSGEQLYLSDQCTQRVRATRSGPGFDKQLNKDMTKASDAFGPGGKTDTLHPDDKPFALTRAGEESDVRPGPSGPNRSAGATRDKAAVADARTKGEFTRTNGSDLAAPKGVSGPQPAQSDWRPEMRDWKGSVPARPQSTTPPATVASPPTPRASSQLTLPNVCEATPSTPAPPPAKPTPIVEPPVAPKAGPGPGALEGAAGKLSGPAAVVGGGLSAKKFAEDLEMHLNPSNPALGPVGTRRTDSQGTVWIKTTPDTWVTQAYYDKMS